MNYDIGCSVTLLEGCYKKDAMYPRRTRKRLVATVSRREGVYNRAGEPSVTFCGRGGMTKRYEKSPVFDRAF